MKFSDLVQGRNDAAQKALEAFLATVPNEDVLWYPSAGADFRDILEMTPARREVFRIADEPGIIIHTDYNSGWTHLDQDVVHQDARTTVRILERHALSLCPAFPVRYAVRPEFVDFPGDSPRKPTILLLKVRVSSNRLGEVERWVFFFMFENYNFLEELVLRHGLRISHLVKIREGCGFGGNRKSISVVYSLLAHIGVRYLLVDDEIHYCRETHARIARTFRIDHPGFTLEHLAGPNKWSGFEANVFRVNPSGTFLTRDSLNDILRTIGMGREVDMLPISPGGEFTVGRRLRDRRPRGYSDHRDLPEGQIA